MRKKIVLNSTERGLSQGWTMQETEALLEKNRAWAANMVAQDPQYFERLASQQAPAYLWIGCADSRVPATQLVDLPPGEMFVHRNVANVVIHTDLNCLSVLHFAIDVLRVRHVIVCGHYGCGGIDAALHNRTFGLIDNWLRHVQDVRNKHAALLDSSRDDVHRLQRLCELNVIEQVVNVCHTTIVQSAWERGQALAVHGWIYGVGNGILRDVEVTITHTSELASQYANAVARVD
jgi:carbonic anhydrase